MSCASDIHRWRAGLQSVGCGGVSGLMGQLAALIVFVAVLSGLAGSASAAEPDFDRQRDDLVAELRGEFVLLALQAGTPVVGDRVLAAIGDVHRHEFVPEGQRRHAYDNRPLPIGHGQTISQPLIVALMTELLDVKAGDQVFELGTGSGYQAAVLAELGVDVFSVEIVEPLADQARERLRRLGYARTRTRSGDGYFGWSEEAPFDAIVVTAAGDHIPPPLIRQLRPGGRMVIPVGGRYVTQQLVLVTKEMDGSVGTREILPVRFVPVTGGH